MGKEPKPYNPWESGLKENQAEELERKAKKEAEEVEAAKAKAAAEKASDLERNAGTYAAQRFAAELRDANHSIDERTDTLKERASAKFKAGELQEAAELYAQALQLRPTHTLYSNRSACCAALRRYEEALADAEQCIKLAPAWGKGYARKGAALHGLYRWTEAVAVYEAGLAADSSEASKALLGTAISDALRRRARAGGQWRLIVDGRSQVSTHTRDGMKDLSPLGCRDELGEPSVDFRGVPRYPPPPKPGGAMVACPGACVSIIDGDQVKVFDQYGTVRRTYNEKFKQGARSLRAPCGIATDGTHMYVAEGTPAGAPGVPDRVEKFDVEDNRAHNTKQEAADKSRGVADRHSGADLRHPHGLAYLKEGVGGEPTLYVVSGGHF